MKRVLSFIMVLVISLLGLVSAFAPTASAATTSQIQTKLSQLGCAPGISDGIYGPRTTLAVKRFQVANSLYIDGLAGPTTQSVLFGSSPKRCVYTGKTLPTGSGSGSRIVVSQTANWVWIVTSNGVLADGGMIDNPAVMSKGTYKACEWLNPNFNDTREWRLNKFVRFCTSSGTRTGMGFHEIPISVATGLRMHSESYLGTNYYQSHGCIRLSVDMARSAWYYTFGYSANRTFVVI